MVMKEDVAQYNGVARWCVLLYSFGTTMEFCDTVWKSPPKKLSFRPYESQSPSWGELQNLNIVYSKTLNKSLEGRKAFPDVILKPLV